MTPSFTPLPIKTNVDRFENSNINTSIRHSIKSSKAQDTSNQAVSTGNIIQTINRETPVRHKTPKQHGGGTLERNSPLLRQRVFSGIHFDTQKTIPLETHHWLGSLRGESPEDGNV